MIRVRIRVGVIWLVIKLGLKHMAHRQSLIVIHYLPQDEGKGEGGRCLQFITTHQIITDSFTPITIS